MWRFAILCFLILGSFLSACSSASQPEEEGEISTYTGPKIGDTLIFKPQTLIVLGDSVASNHRSPYKIFSWIKADCSSCALKFKRWMEFKQNDQITGSYTLYPIVYASSRDMVEYTIEDIIHYPYSVYYDSTNHFFEDNHISEDGYYQTFLVDPHNKVLAIGDPNLDNSYFNTYKRIINGE
ncbi:MAG: hypothetical protein AAFP89_12175 [Bacteroidota bacterium]